MSDSQDTRASFWRETLRVLYSFAKAEWQWIVFFAAVMAIEEITAIFYCNIPALMAELNSVAPDLSRAASIVTREMPNIVAHAIISLGTAGLATYWFTGLFLKHSGDTTAFTFKTFAYWLKNIVWKYALLVSPLVAAGVLLELILHYIPDNNLGIVSYAMAAVFLVWIFYFYYGLYLYYLVSPLAVSADATPLRTSAKLTRDILLRVWWGSMIITVAVFFVVSPFFLLKLAAQDSYGVLAMKTQSISGVVEGIWTSALTAGTSVYACVVMRVLKPKVVEKSKD